MSDLFSSSPPSPDADDAALATALRALGWERVQLPTRSGRPAYCWRDPQGRTHSETEARKWLARQQKEGMD